MNFDQDQMRASMTDKQKMIEWLGSVLGITQEGDYLWRYADGAPYVDGTVFDPFSNIGQAFDLLGRFDDWQLQYFEYVADVKDSYEMVICGQSGFGDNPCDAICYAVLRATGYPGDFL
jgi:hypothetical protein